MPGGVDPPDQIAYFVGAGDAGQESKHVLSVPTRSLLARRRLDEDLDAPDTPVTSEVEYEHFRGDHRLPAELDGFGEFGEREHVPSGSTRTMSSTSRRR